MRKPLPTEALSVLFGSRTLFAAAAGVTRPLLNKWETRHTKLRKRGHVPSRYNPAIIKAARIAGLDHDAVAAHLDMHTCPLCSQPLAAGAMLDPRILRRLGNGG